MNKKIFTIIFMLLLSISMVSAYYESDGCLSLFGANERGNGVGYNGTTLFHHKQSMVVFYENEVQTGYSNNQCGAQGSVTVGERTYGVNWASQTITECSNDLQTNYNSFSTTVQSQAIASDGLFLYAPSFYGSTVYKYGFDGYPEGSINLQGLDVGILGLTYDEGHDSFYILDGPNKIKIYDRDFNYLNESYDFIINCGAGDPRGITSDGNKIYINLANAHSTVFKLKNLTHREVPQEALYVNGEYYSTQSCINPETYCNNSGVVDDGLGTQYLICPSVDDTTYCSGGCTNTLGNDSIYYGECEQFGCVNQCSISGKETCTTQNTYTICGQYDQDACLEYGNVFYCPTGQYCYSDEQGSYCGTIQNETLTYTQNYISVNVNKVNNSGIVNNEGQTLVTTTSGFSSVIQPTIIGTLITTTKKLIDTFSISTVLNKVDVDYSTETFTSDSSSSVDYFAYDCDYKESLILFDDLSHHDLLANGWTTTDGEFKIYNDDETLFLRSVSNSKALESKNDMIIETIVYPYQEKKNYDIELKNNDIVISTLRIYYERNNGHLIITEETSGEELVNSISTSNDLNKIYIKFSYISDVDTLNIQLGVIRDVLGQSVYEYYYSLPIATNGYIPNLINYNIVSGRFYIFQVSESVVESGYPIFQKEVDSNKYHDCSYNTAGCKDVRVYGNTQGIPTYYFNDDILTCVSGLGGVSYEAPEIVIPYQESVFEKILGKQFSDKEKLLYSTLFIVLIFGLFVGVGYITKNVFVPIMGTIFTGLLIVYFTIEGFIPIWVVILFGIIGSLVGTSMLKNSVLGSGGN